MKLFFKYLRSDLLGLFGSAQGSAYLIIQSGLMGLGFYLLMGSGSPAQGAGGSPEQAGHACNGLFAAVLRACFFYYALFFPFVMNRIMPCRSDRVTIDSICAISGTSGMFGPRLVAGLIFLAASHAFVLPAALYWRMLGWELNAAGFTTQCIGYFIYGAVALAVSIFCSSIARTRPAALCMAVMALLLPQLADFTIQSRDMAVAGGAPEQLIIPAIFNDGFLSVPVALFYLSLASALLVISYVRLGPSRSAKRAAWAALIAVFCIAACLVVWKETGVSVLVSATIDWGIPRFVSEKNKRDILLLYLGIAPLLAGFVLFARLYGRSIRQAGRKKAVVAAGTWLVIIVSLALIQDIYFRHSGWNIFPGVSEIVPQRAGGSETNRFKRDEGEKKDKVAVAFDDARMLGNFFNKLTDLKAGRRSAVRVVHYGDSLIWGDCYSNTVKRRFQNEFGDGGRGIVPPVQTLSTALHDHVNTTKAAGFSLASIKHTFSSNGEFHARPAINPLVGFTGEGTAVLAPGSEIRLGVKSGCPGWKRVQVFLRPQYSPGPAEYRVNLDYGAGRDSKTVLLRPGSLGTATFDVPATQSANITINGPPGERPIIDAVNVETGKGVAYSAIVRTGIHMSWMGAIPDQNLAALRVIAPDLVIFQFGINEAASLASFSGFTEEALRSQMREWLAKVKLILPEADFLIIGPPERLQAQQGALVPMKETLSVRRVQREEAARAGMAFFDTHEHLGGEGHMLRLVKAGMAMDDYTHFTFRGGEFAANGFYDALMNAFMKKGGGNGPGIQAGEDTGIRFNSISYLYFLALVIVAGLVLAKKPVLRLGFLIAASYYFYATWMLWPLICLAATTATDYAAARLISRARGRGGRGSAYLALSLAVDLGILFSLKYLDFFSGVIGAGISAFGMEASMPFLNILLPAGISFYTFQSLSYAIDVWRGKLEPVTSFVRYAHYVSSFTQILAGPIVKAREFLPALKGAAAHFSVTRAHVATAAFLILTGFIKKAGADWLGGAIVDRVFASPQMFMPLETLAAVYAYGVQIYGDFSGYTDIAIGSAMLLGFNLTENFRRPYASASVSEFWRRWHISLGSWLREYVYIALGGNRKRAILNIGVTMFVCGLWHGAAVPFVLWGLYHGFFLIIERVTGLDKSAPVNRLVQFARVFLTLHIVLFGWILFRSGSWETFAGVLSSLAAFTAGAPNISAALVVVIISCYALHFTPSAWKERLKMRWAMLSAPLQGCAASCVTVFLYHTATMQAAPFIYSRF